jgi:hypothetical protein
MFTFTIFGLFGAGILAGLIFGLDYFSAPKRVKKEIKTDFRQAWRWLTSQGPTGLGGPHENLGDTDEDDFGDGVVLGPVKTRPATRRIVGWLGGGQVVAIDDKGQEFAGRVVGQGLRKKRGLENEVWIQRGDNRRRWIRCGLPKAM